MPPIAKVEWYLITVRTGFQYSSSKLYSLMSSPSPSPVECHSRRGTVPIKLGHNWSVAVLQIAWERVVDFCFIPSGSHYFTLFVCRDRALLMWATGRKRRKGPVPRLCHTLRVLLCMCYLARDIGNVQQVGAEARSASPSRSKTGCIMHIRGLRHAHDKQVGPSQSAVPLNLHHF